MANDNVSIVRKKASQGVYNLFQKMYHSGNEMYKMCVVEYIKAYAVSPKYTQRQVFVFMIDPIVKDFEAFEENFLDTFFSMVDERVPNVRILMARTISKYATVNKQQSNKKEVAAFLANKKI